MLHSIPHRTAYGLGANFCTALLSKHVRRRVVRQFVPHMRILFLSHMCTWPRGTFQLSHMCLLLWLTVVFIRVFVSAILYVYMFKGKHGFTIALSIFFTIFCNPQCPANSSWDLSYIIWRIRNRYMLAQGSRTVIWKNDSLKNKSFWFDDFKSTWGCNSWKKRLNYLMSKQISGLGNSEE